MSASLYGNEHVLWSFLSMITFMNNQMVSIEAIYSFSANFLSILVGATFYWITYGTTQKRIDLLTLTQ
jgi:hypothetical protein